MSKEINPLTGKPWPTRIVTMKSFCLCTTKLLCLQCRLDGKKPEKGQVI